MEIIETGWLVTYKDGSKEIMTVQVFDEHSMGMLGGNIKAVESETEYADITKAVKENPAAPVSW